MRGGVHNRTVLLPGDTAPNSARGVIRGAVVKRAPFVQIDLILLCPVPFPGVLLYAAQFVDALRHASVNLSDSLLCGRVPRLFQISAYG